MRDFSEWSQESLARLASELLEENKELRQQVRVLLDALRTEWTKENLNGKDA